MCAKKFTVFESYLDAIEEMPEEQQGVFAVGLIKYGIRGAMPDFKESNQRIAFKLIKPIVDSHEKDNKRKKKQSEDVESMENPRKIHGKSTESLMEQDMEHDKEKESITQIEFALEGGSCPSEQKKTSCYPFEQFWEDYGLKQDRKRCEEKFKKLSEDDRAAIRLAIPRYKAYCQAKSISMKNPLTFLNGACWDDDFTIPQQPQQTESPLERGLRED